jgi:PKD repeat protein
MPGRWIPRNGFPAEYMPMELFGFGGLKPLFRAEAAVEFAQTLVDISFFEGACSPDNILPTVTASASTGSGSAPLEVTFTATASDLDGTVASYLWTFGDGSTSTEQNPVHIYNCDGTFTAKVKVTDNNCGIAVDSVEIIVGPSGNPISYDCDVAPILEQYCNGCHGSAGGLSTRTCEGLESPGDNGYSVIPGDKSASSLYRTMIDSDPVIGVMPLPNTTGPMDPAEIATVGDWIDSLDPACAPNEFCTCSP